MRRRDDLVLPLLAWVWGIAVLALYLLALRPLAGPVLELLRRLVGF